MNILLRGLTLILKTSFFDHVLMFSDRSFYFFIICKISLTDNVSEKD